MHPTVSIEIDRTAVRWRDLNAAEDAAAQLQRQILAINQVVTKLASCIAH